MSYLENDNEMLPDLRKMFPKSDAVYRQYSPRCYSCGIGFLLSPSDQLNATPCSYSFSYIMYGRMRYTDSAGRSELLQSGMVFQRHPGRTHSTEILSDEYAEAFMELDSSWYDLMKRNEIPLLECRCFNPGFHMDYLRQFSWLKERLNNCMPRDVGAVIGRMITLMCDMYIDCADNDLADSAQRSQIHRALGLLADESSVFANYAELAAAVGMRPDAFRKAFKNITGHAPGEFMIRKRIDRACAMLKVQNRSIKEIADLLGYPDVYTFSKQFKKFIGCPPSKFCRTPER